MQTHRQLMRSVVRPLRDVSLKIEMRRLRDEVDRERLDRMVKLWANDGWEGDADYLEAIARAAKEADGAILECGSGLSTLVAAACAQHGVWSLEHLPEWVERARSFALEGATVHHAPLRPYGTFEWYDVPVQLPDRFALVICDGPPNRTTMGGRYGLMPIMSERLQGATVLLDDTDREDEREIVARWEREFDVETIHAGRYSVLKVAENP